MAVVGIACGSSMSAAASASTTVGKTFSASAGNDIPCTPASTIYQRESPGAIYSVPINGVITSWTSAARADPTTQPDGMVVRLVSARYQGRELRAAGVSEDETLAGPTHTSFPASIPVQAGDLIGLSSPYGGIGCLAATGTVSDVLTVAQCCAVPRYLNGGYRSAGYEVNLSAVVEPDVDGDCLGDDSQDAVISPSSARLARCDLSAPTTAWVKRPPKKTTKTTVVVRYRSDDPAAIFESRLDRDPWYPSGPGKDAFLVGSLEPGRHVLKIRAVDEASNVDSTPIRASFRTAER